MCPPPPPPKKKKSEIKAVKCCYQNSRHMVLLPRVGRRNEPRLGVEAVVVRLHVYAVTWPDMFHNNNNTYTYLRLSSSERKVLTLHIHLKKRGRNIQQQQQQDHQTIPLVSATSEFGGVRGRACTHAHARTHAHTQTHTGTYTHVRTSRNKYSRNKYRAYCAELGEEEKTLAAIYSSESWAW